MYTYIMMAAHRILDRIRGEGFSEFIHRRFHRDRILVPVEMDLIGDIPFCGHRNPKYQFVEVKLEDIEGESFTYPVASRYYKTLWNLKKGLRNFAVAIDGSIIGDIWCTTTEPCGKPHAHGATPITGLTCQDWEVYAFDMSIDPSFRGKNLAVPLQRFLQSTLKSEGYTKVYGYYWEDNVSALWMHRLLKFKEYPKRKITRILMYSKVEEYEQPPPTIGTLATTAEYCWEYKNCSEETKATCMASIQTEQQCWELFMEDGKLRQDCKTCQFRLANTLASAIPAPN